MGLGKGVKQVAAWKPPELGWIQLQPQNEKWRPGVRQRQRLQGAVASAVETNAVESAS